MLLLLLYVGDMAYALDTDAVVEVIPKVNLKSIPQAPSFVSGRMNFAGIPVPVVDLAELLEKRPSSNAMHTRIVILKDTFEGQDRYMGLMGEKITETFERDAALFVESGFNMQQFPYLKGVLTEGGISVQFVSVEELFQALHGVLFQFAVE